MWKQHTVTLLELYVTFWSAAYEMLGDFSSGLGCRGTQPGCVFTRVKSCYPGSESTDAPDEFISWGWLVIHALISLVQLQPLFSCETLVGTDMSRKLC